MSDLLEFLLNVVLEILCGYLDFAENWRFYVPLLGSFAVVALIMWRVTDSGAEFALSVPVVATGIVAGLAWEIKGACPPRGPKFTAHEARRRPKPTAGKASTAESRRTLS
jgi:hypothetical protein